MFKIYQFGVGFFLFFFFKFFEILLNLAEKDNTRFSVGTHLKAFNCQKSTDFYTCWNFVYSLICDVNEHIPRILKSLKSGVKKKPKKQRKKE